MIDTLRIAGTIAESVVDGPGLRCVVFTQGCPHHCPGCHNPDTHDPSAGRLAELPELARLWLANPLIEGLTISGGEPFLQARACASLSRLARAAGLDVIVYTGYTLEQLRAANRTDWNALLAEADTIIDGPFILEQRSLELPFRGSRNQRIWQSLAPLSLDFLSS